MQLGTLHPSHRQLAAGERTGLQLGSIPNTILCNSH